MILYDEYFETGYKLIDVQHKHLVHLMNRYEELLYQNNLKEAGKILNDFMEYTSYHFLTEEKIYKTLDYKNLEEHKELHSILKKKLQQYIDLFLTKEEGDLKVLKDVLITLTNWIEEHLLIEDQLVFKSLR